MIWIHNTNSSSAQDYDCDKHSHHAMHPADQTQLVSLGSTGFEDKGLVLRPTEEVVVQLLFSIQQVLNAVSTSLPKQCISIHCRSRHLLNL